MCIFLQTRNCLIHHLNLVLQLSYGFSKFSIFLLRIVQGPFWNWLSKLNIELLYSLFQTLNFLRRLIVALNIYFDWIEFLLCVVKSLFKKINFIIFDIKFYLTSLCCYIWYLSSLTIKRRAAWTKRGLLNSLNWSCKILVLVINLLVLSETVEEIQIEFQLISNVFLVVGNFIDNTVGIIVNVAVELGRLILELGRVFLIYLLLNIEVVSFIYVFQGRSLKYSC